NYKKGWRESVNLLFYLTYTDVIPFKSDNNNEF
ncbi:TPA: HIT family protein, partial [Vibrio vulnificus]|nr:HIT family protein [Vibrio vulnificus]